MMKAEFCSLFPFYNKKITMMNEEYKWKRTFFIIKTDEIPVSAFYAVFSFISSSEGIYIIRLSS